MGILKIMDGSGDKREIWDPTRPDEVESARASYNLLTRKGYNAYGVKVDGGKGDPITEFDPGLGKILLVPALRGG
jgi:hypothetical protein